ncbi:hypothetical protein EW146_g6687, partial [Bondarzewia mesenterica]
SHPKLLPPPTEAELWALASTAFRPEGLLSLNEGLRTSTPPPIDPLSSIKPAWDPSSRTPGRNTELETFPSCQVPHPEYGVQLFLWSYIERWLDVWMIAFEVTGSTDPVIGFQYGQYERHWVETVPSSARKVNPLPGQVVVQVAARFQRQIAIPFHFLKPIPVNVGVMALVMNGSNAGFVGEVIRERYSFFIVKAAGSLAFVVEPRENLVLVNAPP